MLIPVISVLRYVNQYPVIFTEGNLPDYQPSGGALNYPDPRRNITDFGGFYIVGSQRPTHENNDYLDFDEECKRLYKIFQVSCSCVRAFARDDYTLERLGLLSNEGLQGLLTEFQSAFEQTDWSGFDGYKPGFEAAIEAIKATLAWRSGYEIKQSPNFGYVYLIKSSTGHYKIGKSIEPDKRINQFVSSKVILPIDFSLEHYIPTDDYHELEARLQKRYEDKRFKGEWFDLSEHDVHTIKLFQVIVLNLPVGAIA